MRIKNRVYNTGDIAIIGFSCRFPGAMNASQFWDNLKKGIVSITTIPRDRWNIDTFYSPNIEDDFKSISKYGGFIDHVDLFDAKYFRIKEERAKLMEPQQRLILEISAEAINQAGYTGKDLSGSQASVFIGAVQGDYGSSNEYISLDNRIISDGSLINHRNGFLGNLPNMISSIVSNYFNLMGPSVTVSTACSSSLVSIHLACQSILSGESDLAIAGGIQLYLSPIIFIGTSKTGVLSSDDKCRTFSKSAKGYVLAEGAGVCLLKRLEDAVNDGDSIYAIIKSSAVNNDGKTISIIMPNSYAQQKVILQALEKGGIDAASISYFEANGTAMRIGDPLEVKAAASAYKNYTDETQYCTIGSVEQNIGHAAHAAGIASLIKVILCLLNKQIPPALYCDELNPDIDFPNTPFCPNRELIEWKPRQNCRRAGINAFGFGGTNCHVILEDFNPERYDKYEVKRKPLPPIKFIKKRYRLNDNKQNVLSNDAAKAEEEFLLQKLKRDLTKHISEISKVKEKDIELDGEMGDYNFDSISFTELANRINGMCNLEITPAIFFEHPSIDSFARYLCNEYTCNLLHHYRDSFKESDTVVQKEQDDTCTEKIKPRGRFQPLMAQDVKSEGRIETGKEPVAIIGMSGVMPQSEDLETFWKHLEEGENLITEIPKDRWDWQSYYGDPGKEENKTNVKCGAFINDVDKFDAMFFGILPREAELMDPQQRIFLETVWKAIEDAGYKASNLSGTKTGLFVGVMGIDYFELLKDHAIPVEAHLSTGIAHSILANRISYLLDLHGPSEAIDTACSSSLVAVHRAVQAIRNGNCDMAIAGGINIIIRPTVHIALSKAGMLCEDGQCKTFDKRANGYVRGEGAGAIFLKPLNKAIADEDHIYAVIKGIAENHGGRANSLTAPNPNAQAELLIKAYEEAGIDPNTVSYIETHGTGTSLGDPIEVNGLKKAFEEFSKRRDKTSQKEAFCGIGSVKTNIGHLESAAGIAGVIKILLSMKYKKLPASINFEELNPYIKLQGSPFYIVNETKHWECLRDDGDRPVPRRAGVSSFGFGGTNAHIVLEEYEKQVAHSGLQSDVPRIIVLSAKNEDRMKFYAERIIAFIEKEKSLETGYSLADIAYTLQVGREALEERLAVIVSSTKELREKLVQFCQGKADIEDLYTGNVKADKSKGNLLIDGEEGVEFIKLVIKNKKFNKLMQLWVSGVEIDWRLLYPADPPKRISLPTYPFARERYWINEREDDNVVPERKKENERIKGNFSTEFHEKQKNRRSVFENITDNKHILIGGIRKIFSDALRIDSANLKQDIAIDKFGVDSILLMDIFNRISNKYQLKLKLPDVQHLSTIKQLAEYIYDQSNGKTDIIISNKSNDEAIKSVTSRLPDNGKINDSQLPYYSKFIDYYKYAFSSCKEYRNFIVQSSQKINVEVITCGEGEPIILLSPIFSLGTSWIYQMLEFSKEYKLIVFHYPGYGRSEYSAHYSNFNDIADCILELIDILNIQKPYNLVGWSMGGLISQIISLKQKQRIKTLTLVNTTCKLEEEDSTKNFSRIINLLIKDFESHVPESMRTKREGSMDFIKAHYNNEVALHYTEQVLKFDFSNQLSKIHVPTLIITGGKDALTPPRYSEYLHEKIKNSEYHVLKKGGHYIPLQNHMFFNEKLNNFVIRK